MATVNDLVAIQEVERAAGQAFRTVGMDSIADDEPIGAADFGGFLARDVAWVTVANDAIVAYLLMEPLDTAMHIEQVTVHPGNARRGIGARLIDVAAERATHHGLVALTLTTFRDVPWNAPYYARLGFAVVAQEEWGPELRKRVANEAMHGLERWPRVAMLRSIG